MGKPQDLPAGETQMFIALVLNFVTYVVALMTFNGFGEAAMHAAIDLGCTGLLFYFGLRLVNRVARFEQAFGALCGAGAVLNVVAIVLLRLTAVPDGESAAPVYDFSMLLLLVWSLSLLGLVLRHTFSIGIVASITIAVTYYVFVTLLLGWLFPPTDTAEQLSTLVPWVWGTLQTG